MCFTAFSVFEVANKKIHNSVYDLHVLSEKRGPVSMEEIAVETGFGARERMRRAFCPNLWRGSPGHSERGGAMSAF